jgi:hypothetical protein
MTVTRRVLVTAIASRLLLGWNATADPRGGRVGWARLITSDAGWGVHSDQDPKLASFIRSQTSLNIDPIWYSVRPSDLKELCAYPFVYVKDLTRVSDPSGESNLQEYLRRGGFICVDPCTARFSAVETELFFEKHEKWFARLFPTAVIRTLPDAHEIFRCYFTVGVDDLFTPDMIRAGAVKPPQIGMRGVFEGDHLIAVISTSGLECGWPQTPQRMPGCMKLIVNAYVYAMTR